MTRTTRIVPFTLAAAGWLTAPDAWCDTGLQQVDAPNHHAVDSAADQPVAPEPPRSPFEYIRWKDLTPEVKIGDAWYHLEAINAVPVEEIFDHCRKRHFSKWRKQFDENLVQVLSDMGQPPGDTVVLDVRELNSRQRKTLENVPLTEENHRAIMAARYGNLDERDWLVGTPGVDRPHRGEPHPAFVDLTKRIETARPWAEPRLTRRQVAEDLDDLEWHLTHRYAYADRAGFDYRAALDTLRAAVTEDISRGAFAVQLMKLLSYFGDGHTRLNRWSDININKYVSWAQFLPSGFTPFAMADVNGRIAAYGVNPVRFLDEEFPYVKTLDGVEINRWIEAAGTLVARGSPQFVRANSVKYGAFAAFIRSELGLPAGSTVAVELESADRARTQRFPLSLASAPHVAPIEAWVEHKKLAGDVGLLRLARMEDEPVFFQKLLEAMRELRNTRALVIDVRGNTGGSREALSTLFPFFMAPDAPPFVANVAAYRVPPKHDRHRAEGFLASRSLYPVTSQFWSDAERAAIRRFAETFTPKWPLDREKFSDWHYFVLAPRHSAPYFHYDNPVAVLMDSECFDATDVLLGAFKGWPKVTLVGTPSGGGDGRATNLALLINSGFRIQFSSMASFRPDGRLYDGAGIEPDVVARPILSDVVGKTDSVLDAAVRRLKKQLAP